MDVDAPSSPSNQDLEDVTSTDKVEVEKASLLGLPTELFENNLERALLSIEPIEFAPFRDSFMLDAYEYYNRRTLTALQHQHALNFQETLRPSLGVLSVNRKLRAEASRVYYSRNTFHFTNGYGWLALARFFDLIGKENIQSLKHIQIAHPVHHINIPQDEAEDFFVQQLSPFGMADLPNYASTYLASSEAPFSLVPVRDPLTALRTIHGLEHVDLLLYGQDRMHTDILCGSQFDVVVAAMTTVSFDTSLSWTAQPGFQITLINLSPRFDLPPGVQFLKLSSAKTASEESATLNDVHSTWWTLPTRSYRFSNTVEAAVEVASFAKSKGWAIADHDWSPKTGYDALRDRTKSVPEPPPRIKHKDCVRCFRKGGFNACSCNDRPALLDLSAERRPRKSWNVAHPASGRDSLRLEDELGGQARLGTVAAPKNHGWLRDDEAGIQEQRVQEHLKLWEDLKPWDPAMMKVLDYATLKASFADIEVRSEAYDTQYGKYLRDRITQVDLANGAQRLPNEEIYEIRTRRFAK